MTGSEDTNGSAPPEPKAKRARTVRNFPATTFEDALTIPLAIQQHAAGQKVRRVTLFEKLGKSPDSGPSRQMVTNSSKYGLTTGSYKADHLDLTDAGRIATSAEVTLRDRLTARFKLSIEDQPPFRSLYHRFKGNRLPAQAVLRDHLTDEGYADDEVSECVDTFILNAKFLGLLRSVSGAERLLPVEHVLEEMPATLVAVNGSSAGAGTAQTTTNGVPASTETTNWDSICFYITPIGADESDERMHSDLFLNSIVAPALEELGLTVVRADHIGKPGMITAQVIEHVIRARLVVADLSYHNPNVFYELSLRHACKLPTVQIIRAADRIPFDLDQFRTVRIDTTNIYSLVPQLDVYRAEIATHARRTLDQGESVDNPLTAFCPGLEVTIPPITGANVHGTALV